MTRSRPSRHEAHVGASKQAHVNASHRAPSPARESKAKAERQVSAPAHTIERIPPQELRAHKANVRTHARKQVRQIADAIAQFGFQNPIIVNGENTILAGHGRVEAAKLLGLARVPCLRVIHLTRAEERAYAIADNKIASNAGWDRAVLAAELGDLALELPELGIDVAITGFEVGEIDALLVDHEDDPSDPADDVDRFTASTEPVSREGDLWHLGDHRILCGDACDPAAYDVLLDGERAAMAITDPPWNVPVNGHVGGRGKVRREEFAFASGDMSAGAFAEFLKGSLGRMMAACKAGALLYVFIDWRHVEVLCRVARSLGLDLANLCVWNKTTPGQGSFYRSAHELVGVFHKPGATATNNIALGRYGRSRTNVWTFAPPNKFKSADDLLSAHPTPKPVALVAEAIKDASRRRAIVLDAFVGSGTTILAAEKVGRIGYGIECAPVFVDLTIRRWQEFTGKDAILTRTGQSFGDIAAERQAPGNDSASSSGEQPGGDPGKTDSGKRRRRS